MIETTFINLYYYLSQALLGSITDRMRAISAKYDESKGLFIYVYMETTPLQIDSEIMFDAISEAESMFDKKIEYDIIFQVTSEKFCIVEKYDFWLFMRYENNL